MVNPEKGKSTEKALTPDEALSKLEQFCAYRERCPQEVYQKLNALGVDANTAEQIFQVLEGDGYVNEERFAEAYAGGKFRINHWGRVRIRLELQRRKIAPVYIQQALAAIDPAEYEAVLVEQIRKKKRQYKADPKHKRRNKLAAAMIRAGFEPDLVFQNLREEDL